MIRNLKILSFALAAIAVMIGAGASAVSAASFTAAEYPATVSGSDVPGGQHLLTAGGQEIECATTSYTGILTTASEELTVTPTYEKCTGGSRGVTITLNGCAYVLTTTAEGSGDTWPLKADVECPGGKSIEVHVYKAESHESGLFCTMTAGAQGPVAGLTAHLETPSSTRITGALTFAVEVHGECSFGLTIEATIEQHVDATLTGSVVIEKEEVTTDVGSEQFTAAEYPVTISGTDVKGSVHALTGAGIEPSCAIASYSGTLSSASSELTITPTYEECTTGSRGATITLNGCAYVFTTTAEGSGDTWPLKADVECPGGKSIEVHVYKTLSHESALYCTLTIGAQTGKTGLTAHLETPNSVRVTGTVGAIAETHGECSFGLTVGIEVELHVDATLTGSVVVEKEEIATDIGPLLFTAEEYPAKISGTDVEGGAHAIIGAGLETQCAKTNYAAELAAPSVGLTVIPAYEECTSSGGKGATITMNGCAYVFTTTAEGNGDRWPLNFDVECPAGKAIEIHSYKKASHASGLFCTLTIGSQVGKSGVTAHLETPNSIRVTGVVAAAAETHGECSSGVTAVTTAELHVDATLTGRNNLSEGIATDIG